MTDHAWLQMASGSLLSSVMHSCSCLDTITTTDRLQRGEVLKPWGELDTARRSSIQTADHPKDFLAKLDGTTICRNTPKMLTSKLFTIWAFLFLTRFFIWRVKVLPSGLEPDDPPSSQSWRYPKSWDPPFASPSAPPGVSKILQFHLQAASAASPPSPQPTPRVSPPAALSSTSRFARAITPARLASPPPTAISPPHPQPTPQADPPAPVSRRSALDSGPHKQHNLRLLTRGCSTTQSTRKSVSPGISMSMPRSTTRTSR